MCSRRSSWKTITLALCVGLSWTAIPARAQQTDLTTDNASRYRGQQGKRITVVCPPNSANGAVWGSDVYTDDSSICGAAVHAGINTSEQGGVVTAVITPGRDSYSGSTRNGITSRSYGPWNSSFTVEKGDGGQIDWSTKAAGLENLRTSLAVVCPAGGDATATVWGSGAYTDDSAICVAAVHAGVITPSLGGRVVIEPSAGQPSYRAASRNGVTSREFGRWPRSFQFQGALVESRPVAASVATNPRAPIATASQPVDPTKTAGTLRTSSGPLATAASASGAKPVPTAIESHRVARSGPVASSRVIAPNDPAPVHATGFTAVAGYGVNILSWKAAPGAIGYRLARATWDPGKLAFVKDSDVSIPTARMVGEADLIPATTYEDRAVTPGAQYVYWLDTNYKSAGGEFYFATTSPWPSVTVTPRDAAGMSWLPADWQAAPELTRVEIVAQDPGGKSTATVKMDWRPKGGAIGYIVSIHEASSVQYRPGPGCTRAPRPIQVAPSLPSAWYITLATSATLTLEVALSEIHIQHGVKDLRPWGCLQVVAVYPNKLDPATGTPSIVDAFYTEIKGPGPEARFKINSGAVVSGAASAAFWAPSLLSPWEYIAP